MDFEIGSAVVIKDARSICKQYKVSYGGPFTDDSGVLFTTHMWHCCECEGTVETYFSKDGLHRYVVSFDDGDSWCFGESLLIPAEWVTDSDELLPTEAMDTFLLEILER